MQEMNMDHDQIAFLSVELKAFKGAYKLLKESAEAEVSRWRWATDRYYSVIPFEQERFRMKRGRLIDSAPAAPKDCCAFGLNAADRLCVLRVYGSDGKPATEQFISYEDNRALARTFLRGGKAAGKVTALTFDNGLPLSSYVLGAEGDRIVELYRYSDGQLISIEVSQYHAMMKKTFVHRYEFDWKRESTVEAIRIDASGKSSGGFTVDIRS